MENLVKNILKDVKESSKTFVFLFGLFLIVLYAEDQLGKQKPFSYNSEMVFTQPDAISSWASFNKLQFKQDLYHYLIDSKTKNEINKVCNLENSEQTSDMTFNRDGFTYVKFSIFHSKPATNDCLDKIFIKIISNFFEEYLTKIIQDNKILMQYMKNETLSVNSNLFLSTFRNSYRAPQLIEKNVNVSLNLGNTDHTKIIIIAFIFSALLSLFLSNLLNKYKRKKKRSS